MRPQTQIVVFVQCKKCKGHVTFVCILHNVFLRFIWEQYSEHIGFQVMNVLFWLDITSWNPRVTEWCKTVLLNYWDYCKLINNALSSTFKAQGPWQILIFQNKINIAWNFKLYFDNIGGKICVTEWYKK